jgi:hypothetical protein
MAQRYVTVTCNADSTEELEAALGVVSQVLDVQAVPGEMLELASDQPPFDVIINVVNMLTGLYIASGGPPICKLLLDKLQERFTDRRVQAQFSMGDPKKRTILYHAFEDTPNEALTRIAYDYQRERDREDPTPMRWWAEGEWKTIAEYQEWLKRK